MSDNSWFADASNYDQYKIYYDYCPYVFGLALFIPLLTFAIILIFFLRRRASLQKQNCKLILKLAKILSSLTLILTIPVIIWESTQFYEFLRVAALFLGPLLTFMTRIHFSLRWTALGIYIISLFFETYYLLGHSFSIYCVAKGMCVAQKHLWIYQFLYWRTFVMIIDQKLCIYLIIYLMVALGFVSDVKEFSERDLDDFDVERTKKVSIYDFITPALPYYASLKNTEGEHAKKKKLE